MDLFRFIRRKNPYAEFDELLGDLCKDSRPSAFRLFCRDMKYYARKFLHSLRGKRRVNNQEPMPDWCIVVSPRIQVEAMRRAGIKDGIAKLKERNLLWWNSLSPEQQAKVHPNRRPRGDREGPTSRVDILQWWYSLTPGEQARVDPNIRPAPIGRDPRQPSNPSDARKTG